MRRPNLIPAILFALSLAAAVAGCGQKGPLKLPPDVPKPTPAAGTV